MAKQGVLLVNLGSPDSTSVGDVRRYLREFLMDGRVIDSPWLVRAFVVNLFILPNRPKESAHAYGKVWTPEGSPLVVISRRVLDLLKARVDVPVELAMRYRNPSIEQALRNLKGQGVENLLLVPLFPHYAMSSFETAVVRVKELAARICPGMSITVKDPYFDEPDFIEALVESARPYLDRDHDHLLFSFHGLPERHLRKSDPTGAHCLATPDCCTVPSPAHATCYRAQCYRTARAFVARAGIPEGRYSVAFQSRLGDDPWLKPYTDFEIKRLAGEGTKRMLVICPAFVSDCLETLEEIGMRAAEDFREAGGHELTLIPCLNEHPAWIRALENMVRGFTGARAAG